MALGYITAQVFAAREAVPVRGAGVRVVRKIGDGEELVAFRLTDRDGKTDTIEVEAPSPELTEEPSETAPFSLFDILIEHPLYYPVLIRDVQVFGGLITLQNTELIPIDDNPSQVKSRTETVLITPQNL